MAQTRTEPMKLSAAKQQFSQVVNRVFRREARILVEKSGIPVAALVSVEDLRRLEQLDAEWARDFAVFDEVGAAFAGTSPEEIEQETARAVAQARAES
ncbi:MAG TPA: type II toxin-antitoxin system Phd/YefM family antitoxin [Thermomicrobiaceae bacterium]|nr:type II toxin-antitoxin system Phd/YefM family antitoxin [Thermomicrobiaceae bacterium]